jgi:endonuclease/exonuclease/phosphatase family metal-dependent hydrolase
MRLRVATLNAWALPWGLARHTEPRLAAIGAALPALDADVVALQEVWTPEAQRALVDAGQRAGLTGHWHNRGGRGNSGLLVLSRLPIAEARFDAFRVRGLPERVWHGDYWSGKGFALLGLRTPQGPLAFLDTHLHAEYAEDVGDEYRTHRMAQVVQLALALTGVQVPLIAAGDFNLRDDQPHHAVLTGIARLRDAALEAGRPQATVLAASPYRGRSFADARIDYVFVRDGVERALRVQRVERRFDEELRFGDEGGAASDHAGLVADLEIAPVRAPGERAPDPRAVALARRSLEEGRTAWRERLGGERLAAAGALAAGGLAVVAARRPPLSRRRFLAAGLAAGGVLALPAGLAMGAWIEWSRGAEAEALDALLRDLDALGP